MALPDHHDGPRHDFGIRQCVPPGCRRQRLGRGHLYFRLGVGSTGGPSVLFRHYIVDGGKFPSDMSKDLLLSGQTQLGPKRAGMLPYVALAGGVIAMFIGYFIFWGG